MQVQPVPFSSFGVPKATAPTAAAMACDFNDTVSIGQTSWLRPQSASQILSLNLTPRSLSTATVEKIAANPNPVVRNLQITDYYHDVAVALRDMIGKEGGNNWPAWACWASKHVGEHVRREDLPILRGTCNFTNAIARAILPSPLHAAIWGPSDAMDRAHHAVSTANRDIFHRTCGHFSRFIETFQGDQRADQDKWTRFSEGFKPGSYEESGEDLLRDGFRSYYQAMFEPDPKKKAELVLLGNCQIVFDEQKHADEEINVAIPWYAGRPVTSWSLYLDTPSENLRLGKDLPLRPDGRLYPPMLEELENSVLQRTFAQHSRAGGQDSDGNLIGSAAKDYRKIEQRMNMIVNVFRTRADDESLFQAPFNSEQTHQIQAGRIPEGEL